MVGLFSSSRTNDSSSAVGMFGRVAPSCPRDRTGVAGPAFILSATVHLVLRGLLVCSPEEREYVVIDGVERVTRADGHMGLECVQQGQRIRGPLRKRGSKWSDDRATVVVDRHQ